MRNRLVVGNWKMHGSKAANPALLEGVAAGASGLEGAECAVCVPYPYLEQAAGLLQGTKVALGAQNASEHAQGAFTGEVSAAMLAEFGCRYVLVGHSERRQLYGEGDGQVAAKFAAVLAAGMKPVLCVGETLEEREAGCTEVTVARQLDAVLAKSGRVAFATAVVAYEPVWAIGTGRTASPGEAQAVHAFLRQRVLAETRILYGGSVKPGNAESLFSQRDVDGGLIGGAALMVADFLAILAAAAQRKG